MICVVDANYPAASNALGAVVPEVIQLAGVDAPTAIDAICQVMPLDLFVEKPFGVITPQEGLVLPPLGVEVQVILL